MRLGPGVRIGDRFDVAELLGEGGMGQVWAARDLATGRDVALKVMRPDAFEHRARFVREARAASAVVHPHVRAVHEALEVGELSIMVMELLHGETLGSLLARSPSPFAVNDAATVLVQIASAAGAMHEAGIVHRDLKPENVFAVGGALGHIKLLDFGIAKVDAGGGIDVAHARTETSNPIGTPHYMAPEQILGEPGADDRIDVWAIGIIAYRLFSGVLPTLGPNVGQVMKKVLTGDLAPLASVAPALPRELAQIVDRMLQLSAEARPRLRDFFDAFLPLAGVAPPPFGQPRTRRSASAEITAPSGVARPHTEASSLPRVATSFVGRRAALAEVRALVGRGALVTLTGPGGSGKTRLAIEAARVAAPSWPGGVWFVDLGRVNDPSRVERAVIAAIATSRGESSLEGRLEEASGRGATLLLLDNCEHVVDEVAAIVERIVGSFPRVTLLATSREPLGLAEEHVLPVDPLEIPAEARLEPVARLLAYDAVALFVDRARQADRSFDPEPDAAAICDVCRRLDGLPLAIELAAARVRVLGVAELGQRIAQHSDLLCTAARGVTPRHQTLRGAIAWSHQLLTGEEQSVHRALGVFAGSFGPSAAVSVARADGEAADGGARALAIISRLVDKSLLVVERRNSKPRFRMLETIRAFARDELSRAGELEAARDRHADFHVVEAQRMIDGARPAYDAIDLELDDYIAADHHLATRAGGAIGSLVLVVALEDYLQHRGHYDLGRTWTDRALEAASADVPSSLRAHALRAGARFRLFSGDYAGAAPLAQQALAAAREVGDPALVGAALNIVGLVADRTLDLVTAERTYLEALASFRAAGDEGGASRVLNNLGDIAFARGDLALALERQRAALDAARRSGGDTLLMPIILSAVALVSVQLGRLDEAVAHLAEAVTRAIATRAQRAGADALDASLHVAERTAAPARALRWYAASVALRARIHAPTDDYYVVLHDAATARARAALGDAAADESANGGAALSAEDALAEVDAWLREAR